MHKKQKKKNEERWIAAAIEEGAKYTVTSSAAAYESVCKGSRVESNITIYTNAVNSCQHYKQFNVTITVAFLRQH